MTLAFKYEKETDIPEALKAEYVEKNGVWVIDVDGMQEATQLRSALDNERRQHKETKSTVTKLLKEKDDAIEEALKKGGDMEAITKSYEDKIKKIEKEGADREAKRINSIKEAAKREAATKLAAEISTVPALMKNAIMERLYVDMGENDEPIVRVSDSFGKPSALGLVDLRKELVDNKEYAAIIKASNASGGGAGDAAKQGAGSGGAAGTKLIAQMTPAEMKAAYEADKAGFIARRDAEQQQALMNAAPMR